MSPRRWSRTLAGLALAAPIPHVAHAAAYLTEAQAAAALLPGVALSPRWEELTPEEVRFIQARSGERVLAPRARVLWAKDGRAVVVDRVVGKHEFITYAVAVSSDGAAAGVEIMDYRETYGDQVRGAAWRRQFAGKRTSDPVRVGKDIRNISGATLSSVHVADGVRRVLWTYDRLRARG
jgi:Na+-translocating ferredoxin:NAD+ oxidoreductase RnfG subunit